MRNFIYSLIFLYFLPYAAGCQSDSITVYIFLKEDCVISQNYTPTLNRLYRIFSSSKIGFIGLFPSSREEHIAAFAQKYQVVFPLKSDYFQERTKALGATVTPEVIIYNEKYKEILYQGRIDDTYYRVGKKRTSTTSAELEDALKAIVAGKPIETTRTEAIGCLINLN